FDLADEAGLLARIAGALPPQPATDEAEFILEFAGYRLDLAGHNLADLTGKDIPLTRGEFDLLRAFAARAGRVLSRDQLLQLIAGRESEAYDRSIDTKITRLRRKIERDQKSPSIIVTMPGSGYKFAAAVRKVTASPSTRPPESADPDMAVGQLRAAVRVEDSPTVVQALPDKPSVAVLPFQNISSDPEQEYFADGIVEDIVTALSRIKWLFVIARHSSSSTEASPSAFSRSAA